MLVCVFFYAVLCGCTTPAARFARQADADGLVESVVQGTKFLHVVFAKNAAAARDGTLHVYLDGDGTPFVARTQVAADPTTRSRLVLDLMARDLAPAVLLGRPCYYQQTLEATCSPVDWTSGRYSEKVVASLQTALTQLHIRYAPRRMLLIGYSGGGVLAVLLAPRFADVAAVVTIAANLDTEAWTGLHGYSPLSDSLNPADRPALPPTLRQWHWFGAKDDNVPKEVAANFLRQAPLAHVTVVPDFDHACCWAEYWPVMLRSATQSIDAAP